MDRSHDPDLDYEPSGEAASTSCVEPAVDYEQPKLSTFNSPKAAAAAAAAASGPALGVNRAAANNNTPSPLTPRQIKQRNSAKRNSSIPCRSSSSTPTLSESSGKNEALH